MRGSAAHSLFLLVAVLLVAALTFVYVHQSQHEKSQENDEMTSPLNMRTAPLRNDSSVSIGSVSEHATHRSKNNNNPVEENDEASQYIQFLVEKFSKPFDFDFDENGTIYPHQVLHLHHMKTGGTSMDSLLRCAVTRWQKVLVEASSMSTTTNGSVTAKNNTISSPSSSNAMPRSMSGTSNTIPYSVIHECNGFMYARCRTGEDASCLERVNQSSVLSYCAPLMDLQDFGWQSPHEQQQVQSQIPNESATSENSGIHLQRQKRPPHVITVLRHPVDRVWSQFRFRTKMCYSCRNLTDVFESIANGDKLSTPACQDQLFDHQTRNLVSTWLPDNPEQMLEEATYNIKHFVTFLGLTSKMNDTAKMVGMLFPFMNETVTESLSGVTNNDTCPMPHRNSSPRNNRCLPNGRHWELPSHPDDATVQAILKYNPMDAQLYERALLHFEYQKRALGLEESDEK